MIRVEKKAHAFNPICFSYVEAGQGEGEGREATGDANGRRACIAQADRARAPGLCSNRGRTLGSTLVRMPRTRVNLVADFGLICWLLAPLFRRRSKA